MTRKKIYCLLLSVLTIAGCSKKEETPPSGGGDGKVHPEWADEITRKQTWYKNWLETTTTLRVNLLNIDHDNEGRSVTAGGKYRGAVWRDKEPKWLFRGREPHEINFVLRDGFIPNKPDGGHMKMDPGMATNPDGATSGLVSTSRNPRDAVSYATDFPEVYVIDAPGGLDLPASFGLKPGQNFDEIAFPGGIRTTYIKGFYRSRKELDGIPVSYVDNPHYRKYAPLPLGKQEVTLAAAGNERENTFLSIDDPEAEEIDENVYLISDEKPVRVVARDKNGKEKLVYWMVNRGMLSNEDASAIVKASCIIIPPGLQVSRHTLVSTNDNMFHINFAEKNTGSNCGVFTKLAAFKDGEFLTDSPLPDSATRPLNGAFGAWIANGVTLVSNSLAQLKERADILGEKVQAVDLHDYSEENSGAGKPGSIEQRFHLKGYFQQPRCHKLTFRVRNNYNTWCAAQSAYPDGKFAGDQILKIQVMDPTGKIVAEGEINIKAAVGTEGPGWRQESLVFRSPKKASDYTVRFSSGSKAGACGPMIAGIEIYPIANW